MHREVSYYLYNHTFVKISSLVPYRQQKAQPQIAKHSSSAIMQHCESSTENPSPTEANRRVAAVGAGQAPEPSLTCPRLQWCPDIQLSTLRCVWLSWGTPALTAASDVVPGQGHTTSTSTGIWSRQEEASSQQSTDILPHNITHFQLSDRANPAEVNYEQKKDPCALKCAG